ncbi:MAG: FAD-dependent oxidoreductase [Oscillospiraceae bacterium]|nr:FAD-dependent oxidoreductase [Oscillospiraceae bacterium]
MAYSRFGTDYDRLTADFVGRSEDYEPKVAQTLDTGIVVVGAGISGLAAAVEAVNRGIPTVLLEHRKVVGGSGMTTLGILAVGSHFQKEQGIEISTGEVIRMEQETFNYRADGARLRDMIFASADNLHWLEENGVEFSGVVDKYMADGHVPTFHWWKSSFGGGAYVNPMRETFERKGGTLLLRTAARKLIVENGTVRGLYAVKADGSVLRINAKAVILANGGFEQNKDLLASRGYDPEDLSFMGAVGHDGSGHFMAWDAGGGNNMEISALVETPYNKNLPGICMRGYCQLWMGMRGRQMCVNGRGERFFDESASDKLRAFPQLAIQHQKRYGAYEIYDQRVMDAAIEQAKVDSPRSWEKAATVIQEALDNGADGVWKADTIEELADLTGIDKERLLKTYADYTRYCENGNDEEFGKAPDRLWKLTGPFYCMKYTEPNYIATLGGVHTGRDSEVLDAKDHEIPGLYAVGMLGTELWPGYYTYGMPGGANAFNVDSGRRAVRHAAEYCI